MLQQGGHAAEAVHAQSLVVQARQARPAQGGFSRVGRQAPARRAAAPARPRAWARRPRGAQRPAAAAPRWLPRGHRCCCQPAAQTACRRGAAASFRETTQSRAPPPQSALHTRGGSAGSCSPCCRGGRRGWGPGGRERAGRWAAEQKRASQRSTPPLSPWQGPPPCVSPRAPHPARLMCTLAPCSSTREPALTSTGTKAASSKVGMPPSKRTEPSGARRKRRCTPSRCEPGAGGRTTSSVVQGVRRQGRRGGGGARQQRC